MRSVSASALPNDGRRHGGATAACLDAWAGACATVRVALSVRAAVRDFHRSSYYVHLILQCTCHSNLAMHISSSAYPLRHDIDLDIDIDVRSSHRHRCARKSQYCYAHLPSLISSSDIPSTSSIAVQSMHDIEHRRSFKPSSSPIVVVGALIHPSVRPYVTSNLIYLIYSI